MTAIWYVKITAKEGEEERVGDALGRLVAPTRGENGCLVFEVFRDASDPRAFSLYEQWTNHETHAVHQQSEHFKTIAQAEVIDHSEPMDVIELELL